MVQIRYRKLKNSISHSVIILATEPDAMLHHLKLGIPGSKTDLHNIHIFVTNKSDTKDT